MIWSFLIGFIPLSWGIKTIRKFIQIKDVDPALRWTHWIIPILTIVWGIFWLYQFWLYLDITKL
jgi:cadmium resistance protein CadD (predicted permease)